MNIAIPLLSALVLLLGLSAFFSMSEAAFLAVNKVRLRHLIHRGSASAKLVYHLLTQLDRLITMILISNNLVNVTISVLAVMLFIEVLGGRWGPLVATAVTTLVLLVLGEITPKLFGVAHADRLTLVLARPLQWLIRLTSPLVWLFTTASQRLIRLLGGRQPPRSPLITEEEIKVMIEIGREAGAVTERELYMLHRIFELENTTVRDVMVPRGQITAVERAQPLETVLDLLVEEGHSRLPVYRGSLDHIEGVIYARDLLVAWRHGGLFVLSDLVRPAYLIPESTRVAELLKEFQRLKIQIAMVTGPHGTTVGVVTLEDLLEEIVGEIEEEVPQRAR